MDTGLVHEIIDCLPQERTLYHYFKDRYAFYLLSRILRPQAARQRLAKLSATRGKTASAGMGRSDA